MYNPPAAMDVIPGLWRRCGRGISSRWSGPNPNDPSSPHPQTKSLGEVSNNGCFCVREEAPGLSLLARLRSRGFIASLDARLFSPRLAAPFWMKPMRTCSGERFLEERRVVDARAIDR